MTKIQTYTGKVIDFENSDPDQIDIEDIAQGLSKVCRFSGQCSEFYSVAQHSVYVSQKVKTNQLQALLHDATEAYMADLPSPIKRLCPNYKKYEARLWIAVCVRFKVPVMMSPALKLADLRMVITEHEVLFKDKDDEVWKHLDHISSYRMTVLPLAPKLAYDLFMERFGELTS